MKAKRSEVLDQNKLKPGELPDIREPVEFPIDRDDQPAKVGIALIITGASIPGASLQYIYVRINIPMVSICYQSGEKIFLRTDTIFTIIVMILLSQVAAVSLTLSHAPEP